jgi:queuosine precursor transporter
MPKQYKIFSTLCALFSILIILNNLTYQKFIVLSLPFIHTFEISVGAILYPLTFLINDLIAEFYGKTEAKYCVKLAICMNMTVALILTGMDHLPATSWSTLDNATFHQVFSVFSFAFIGSMIACYTSQNLDVFIYLSLKKISGSRYLWLRNNISSALCLLVDSIVVISFLSFFNILPKDHAIDLIKNSYSWKLFFTISCTPVFYFSVFLIKKLMHQDGKIG